MFVIVFTTMRQSIYKESQDKFEKVLQNMKCVRQCSVTKCDNKLVMFWKVCVLMNVVMRNIKTKLLFDENTYAPKSQGKGMWKRGILGDY